MTNILKLRNRINVVFSIMILFIIVLGFNNIQNEKRIEELEMQISSISDSISESGNIMNWQTKELYDRIDMVDDNVQELRTRLDEVSLQRVFITEDE